jgi:hypothetical protein
MEIEENKNKADNPNPVYNGQEKKNKH